MMNWKKYILEDHIEENEETINVEDHEISENIDSKDNKNELSNISSDKEEDILEDKLS